MDTVYPKALLEQLAVQRLREAKVLLDASLFGGAFYLSGLSVELALKATIANRFDAQTIPSIKLVRQVFDHDLQSLMSLAGLKQAMEDRSRSDPIFAENWQLAANWRIDSRYALIDEASARSLVEAIADPKSGVFGWIQASW